MPEQSLGNIEETDISETDGGGTSPETGRRPLRNLRGQKILLTLTLLAGSVLIIGLILFKTGALDSYVRGQFVGKMNRMGMAFKAGSFTITLNPLAVRITDAEFSDKETGTRLISIRQADLLLTIKDIWAFRFGREVTIDSVDVAGAQIFIDIDENGRSNFANVRLIQEDEAIKVTFRAAKLSMRDSVVRFGDLQRKIGAETASLTVTVEPKDVSVPDSEKRYGFVLAAEESSFEYDRRKIGQIDIAANGTIGANGADIDEFKVTSAAVDARIRGKVEGWQPPGFDLSVESTIDLTRVSEVLPVGAPLTGTGSFNGKISGRGEAYRIDGRLVSESLSASNVYLKGLDVTAALDGREAAYEANGKAVAKMLTFGDFQIDFPQMVGLLRGNGTDFKWLGDLQAAAAKTGAGSLGGLFISDAVAENDAREYKSSFGRTRAKFYALGDLLITEIDVGDLRISSGSGVTRISAPGAQAATLKTEDLRLADIRAGRIDIRDQGGTTDIKTPRLTAGSGQIGDFVFGGLSSDDVSIKNRSGVTDITADNLTSEKVTSKGVNFGRVVASGLTVRDSDRGLVALSDGMSIARIESESAVLGSINIGGARLTIRSGTVEFRSDDFSAGDVSLPRNSVFATGGNLSGLKVSRPVFVLEGADRYRATADMSLGGGIVGSLKLGAASASVSVTNEYASLQDLRASVMDGEVKGQARIALDDGSRSRIDVEFKNLDLTKLLALQGGALMPLAGHADGSMVLEFDGTDPASATGKLTADINGRTTAGDGLIALTGRIEAEGANGLFQVRKGHLQTSASTLDALGAVDFAAERSDLRLFVKSTDAGEVERVVRSFEFSPELRKNIDEYRVGLSGAFRLEGGLSGAFKEPVIEAKTLIEGVSVRGASLGSLQAEIMQSPDVLVMRNGLLTEDDGGTMSFGLRAPEFGVNNATFNASLRNINFGSVVALLPFEMPSSIRDLRADTSGDVSLSGLPDAMQGEATLSATNAAIGSETFDRIDANVAFQGTEVGISKLRMVIGEGYANVAGIYRTDTTDFDLSVEGKEIPLSRVRALLANGGFMPRFEGLVDLSGKALGRRADSTTYFFEFSGTGKNIAVNSAAIGDIRFNGTTRDRIFDALFEAGGQSLSARIDFSDARMHFKAESRFDNATLNPYISAIRSSETVPITGRATGGISLEGNLLAPDGKGELVFSANDLKGRAEFSQFEIQIDQTPLLATEPVAMTLTDDSVSFDRASFSGGGSNLRLSGTKALTDKVDNNISMVGRVNLALLNLVVSDTFFNGFADVNVRLNGPNTTARLNGRADMVSASVSTFVSSERISVERLKGAVIFTSNQAQIESAAGVLGGGVVTISGGALLGDNLELDAMKFDLRGDNVTVPLPKNFMTTGDATASISARRVNGELLTFVSGRINARRSLYTTNIELADVIGQRKDSPLSSTRGPSNYGKIGLDVIVEGRDALVVRNNLADLTASLSLRVTGDIDDPQVAGRVTANSGTILFRYERYEVQRLELVFPPNTAFEPVINLQAEAEIQGYQVIAALSGSLSDMDTLTANVRSNPALPQADVVSLITTGSLANTESGIPTATQSGISAAADILTDEIISKPISKATDRLFGLNRFEVDPILSGQRLNPTARLTVGRQVNRNLLVAYSTNLSQDQNRVLALEYRLSNRLSVVAQYEQRSLANVTQRANAFSFEIRLRKRF